MKEIPYFFQINMGNSGKKISFPATIRKTKKNHWYITIPASAKRLIVWEKEKVVQVTLEKIP